ncbi:unnamed protein product [Dovyalis caffra]|uniref:Uncharacterized protein n=1 Tax=Dovyalis caffra TaxID=77055 RepID=A0AAV1RYI1_9ROSI|nr:unnamed protein product [Dovyalis caffra]
MRTSSAVELKARIPWLNWVVHGGVLNLRYLNSQKVVSVYTNEEINHITEPVPPQLLTEEELMPQRDLR